jgi:signal transduction histidine kinase
VERSGCTRTPARRTDPNAPAPRAGGPLEGGRPLRVGDDKSVGQNGPSTDAPSLEIPRTDEERLARHLRNLGRMYPVLAHDLHAFLNTMVLNLELLRRAAAKDGADADTAARIRRYAALVADEIGPLDRMLNAVVGQMRLSEPPTTRFDLRALCEELAIVFDSYARHRRLRIRTTLADVPMAIAGDRDAMAHALTSLFLESLDAMPQGSSLTLSLQADRRQASLMLQMEPPAPFEREPGSPEPASTARAMLTNLGARVLHTPGPDGSSVLDVTLPLAPLGP